MNCMSRMNRRTSLKAITVALATFSITVGMSAEALAQTSYTVTRIPVPNGATSGIGRDVNDQGEVIGTTSAGAFYWRSNVNGGQAVAIPNPPDETNAEGSKINNNGYVVGTTNRSTFVWKYGENNNQPRVLNLNVGFSGRNAGRRPSINNANQVTTGRNVIIDGVSLYRACVWEKDGAGAWVQADLPPIAGDNTSRADAISESGMVVGVSHVMSRDASGNVVYGPTNLVSWVKDDAGQWQVSAIPAGLPDAYTYRFIRVNNSGQATGMTTYFNGTNYYERAFFLDLPGATMLSIGTLGGVQSRASGLNEMGQVAGWANNTTGSILGFVWDSSRGEGNPLSLGTLGGTYSRAAAGINDQMFRVINDAGTVVGFAATARDKTRHGFVWNTAYGMRDLNNLTPNKAGFAELKDAYAINASGQIVGIGTVSKGLVISQAYLLTPNP